MRPSSTCGGRLRRRVADAASRWPTADAGRRHHRHPGRGRDLQPRRGLGRAAPARRAARPRPRRSRRRIVTGAGRCRGRRGGRPRHRRPHRRRRGPRASTPPCSPPVPPSRHRRGAGRQDPGRDARLAAGPYPGRRHPAARRPRTPPAWRSARPRPARWSSTPAGPRRRSSSGEDGTYEVHDSTVQGLLREASRGPRGQPGAHRGVLRRRAQAHPRGRRTRPRRLTEIPGYHVAFTHSGADPRPHRGRAARRRGRLAASPARCSTRSGPAASTSTAAAARLTQQTHPAHDWTEM